MLAVADDAIGAATLVSEQTLEQASAPAVRALQRLLDELNTVVSAIPRETYRARPLGAVSGTIGEHMRHCFDHISALVDGHPQGALSYDCRRRGTAVETDPSAARREIARLTGALSRWANRPFHAPVCVSSVVSARGDSVVCCSTLARELAFVLSHTIHHQALIAVLLALDGRAASDRFGLSPSTPRRP